MYDVGLTVGKFAPLHRGHQFLIETALREARHLIVAVYGAPRATDIPLPIRAGWIRTLYPQVEVIEAPDAPESSGPGIDIRREHEAFLARLMSGRRVDVFFSSERYGAWAAEALGCADRVVDARRIAVPISATAIRGDPAAYREYLDPLVLEYFEARGLSPF